MTEETHSVVCATCRAGPVPAPELGEDIWRCSSCGQHDTKEVIYDDAKAHAAAVAQQALDDKLRDMAAKSSMMTYTPGRASSRTFRWVTDFQVSL